MTRSTVARYIFSAAVAFAPMALHAQGMVLSVGGAPNQQNATDTTAKPKGLDSDSLTKLRKFAQTKNPIIVLDDSVVSTKTFVAIPLARIASVELTEASEGDIKFYGNKAQNGILTIKTKPATPDAAKDKSKGRRRQGGGGGAAFAISH